MAIIDTGIDAVHDDLQGNLGTGTATYTGWDGSTLECHCDSSLSADGTCNENWDDDQGHGTHVAGTVGAIAGNGVGVEGAGPDITLHAAKVLHGDYCSCCSPACTGCDSGCTQDCNSNAIVAAAIKWAADQGYDVANMSLGGGGASTAVRDALSYAYYGHSANQGASGSNTTLSVAAAGNPGSCDNPHGDVSYPAQFNQAIAVSATRHDDTLALYSATGEAVELAAPGGTAWDNKDTCEQNESTLVFSSEPRNDYGYKAGTSMATPHVSGAAALLIDKGMDPFMAREQLAESAEDLGLSEDEQGHGLVDPANALGLDSSDDGSNSLPLTVVRGQQTKVDSTTARLFGWWSGDSYTAADIDTVGFQWREYDQSTDQWGSWNSTSTTSIPSDPPKFSRDITIKASSDGCYAYQYYAFVNASDGTSDTSRRRAFWNDRSC